MRWQIRTMMILVVAVAMVVAYGLRFTQVDARWRLFRIRHIEEQRLVRMMQNTRDFCLWKAREAEKAGGMDWAPVASRLRSDAKFARMREEYHRALVDRYSFASQHPMLPVLPDWWGSSMAR